MKKCRAKVLLKDINGASVGSDLGDGFFTLVAPDLTPPYVLSTIPSNNSTNMPVNTTLSATFSEAMDAASFNENTFFVKGGPYRFTGDVSYAGRTATFTPIQFPYDSLLVATVTTGAHDQAGNAMASGYSWQFRTIAPPEAALDPTFGTDGVVKTEFEGSSSQYGHGAYVNSLIIQPDAKIVAAGSSYWGPTLVYDFALTRYNSDGTLADPFGTFGKVVQGFGGDDYLKDIVLQSDGKIVAVGSTYVGGNGNLVLVRYDTDGSPDPAFGTDGVVIADLGGNDSASSLGLQSDGKIVVAGVTSSGNFIARYNSDGTLDSTFGSNGLVVVSPGMSYVRRLAIQDDDKIVVPGALCCYDFAVIRYHANGSFDTTFGTGGMVGTDFDLGTDYAESLAIGPDGKIIVAGWSLKGYVDLALARYNPDGSLDASFGAGGKVTTSLGGGANGYAYDVAILTDGKIVTVGGASNVTSDLIRNFSSDAGGGISFAGRAYEEISADSTVTKNIPDDIYPQPAQRSTE
jgi:uncharacterized delta-60 repeat protein